MTTYRTVDVAVAGGMLRVGAWGPPAPARTLLAVHGVTASHLAWSWLAERLPDVRIVAPDLRGRGRSNTVPGPAGMGAHAADLVAVLDALQIDRVEVVGHSMGAFVSLVVGDLFPERVERLILVDGGLPLALPTGMSPQDAVHHVLGPTAARLSREFTSVDDYLAFWGEHPAFSRDWSATLEAYFAYDLDGVPPRLHPATRLETVEADSLDQNTGSAIATALANLRRPTTLLTAERGLLDETPPLYPLDRLEDLAAQHPGLTIVPVDDVNHYTIAMSERGVDAIVRVLGAGDAPSS